MVAALVAGVISALATGLGALPLYFSEAFSRLMLKGAWAFSGGLMLGAAFFSLIVPAYHGSGPVTGGSLWEVALGILVGSLFFWRADEYVSRRQWRFQGLDQAKSRRIFLIFLTMLLHSFPEGVAIGVAFGSGELSFGLAVALAITIHNIPEGLVVSLPMREQKVSVSRCFWYSVATSVPQPLAGPPAALITWVFRAILPFSLGLAGGAMIYLVLSELIPESLQGGDKHATAWGVVLGFLAMMLIQEALK